MADINDRLERLSRRDELTRRVLQHREVPPEVAGVGADFLDVVEAVANVVRRHPGISIMLAPGDGRQGSAVVRVTEQHGEAEIALVTVSPPEPGQAGPRRREDSAPPAGPPMRPPPAGTAAPMPAAASGPAPAGSGRAEQQTAPVWRPPHPWPPTAAESEHGARQQDGWRWSG